ncbi:MAG: hypothetical protein RMK75_01655 [Aquificaceae bacterium]|nr:hypothetical protein [Aquificaceae bacterium]MDW8423016.1 hypothetical protein [Aquificaceae bacterium]
MSSLLSLLTTLLLLFADFATAEHHHEDHQLHIDCSVCILQQGHVDYSSYKPSLKINLIFYQFKREEKLEQPNIGKTIKHTHSRAPPYL